MKVSQRQKRNVHFHSQGGAKHKRRLMVKDLHVAIGFGEMARKSERASRISPSLGWSAAACLNLYSFAEMIRVAAWRPRWRSPTKREKQTG